MNTKILFCIFFIFSISARVFSVNKHEIDSLINASKALPDKQKTEVYNKIAELYLLDYPEKAIEYSDKAFLIANRINNFAIQGSSLLISGYVNLYQHKIEEAKIFANQALEIFEKDNQKFNLAKSYNLLGQISKEDNDAKSALDNYTKAIDILKKLKDTASIAETKLFIGSVYFKQGKYFDAISKYTESADLYIAINNIKGIINSYSNIALVFRDQGKNDSAILLLNKAFLLSEKYNLLSEKASIYNYIGSISMRIMKYNEALQNYQNSLLIRVQLENEFETAASYSNLGLAYKKLNNHRKAVESFLKSLDIQKKLKNKRSISVTLNHLGSYYWDNSMFDEALRYYLEALNIAFEINDKSQISNLLMNIGIIYSEAHNAEKAIDYLNKAKNYDVENNDNRHLAAVYTWIGNININRHLKIDDALASYEHALKLRQEIGDKIAIASSLLNLGNAYLSQKDYNKASAYFIQAIDISSSINDFQGLANAINSAGNLHLSQGDLNYAEKYFLQGIISAEKNNDQLNKSLCLRKLGDIYIIKNSFEKASEYLNKSLEIGLSINNLELQRLAYLSIHNLYLKLKQPSKALESFKKYSLISDSINKKSSNQNLIDLQIRSEISVQQNKIEDLESEIELQKKNQELKNAELKRQKYMKNLFVLILILVLGIGILFYNRYKLRLKANILLREKFEIIERTNKSLSESESELRKLNSTKDKFFSIIAHDLKNPLSGLMGFTELLTMKNFDVNEDYKQEIYRMINDSSKQLYTLLENLLNWSRSQTGRISYKPENNNLHEIVEANFQLLRINAENKKISLINDIPSTTVSFCDREMITLVVRNLVSNAIKFTPENGEIKVAVNLENAKYTVIIADSGVGIKPEDIVKLFRIDTQFSTQGTSSETGTGLGLVLCKEFIDKHSGQIWVESEIGKGSQFKFTLSPCIN